MLLRSLVVAVDFRGAGLGDELLAAAERAAGVSQAQRIFLLTTTAEEFFSDRGYRAIPRRQAPNCVRASKEFAVLCPGSAQLMVKVVPTRSNDRNPNTRVH
jgi:amino-acid N-acetyltransferase